MRRKLAKLVKTLDVLFGTANKWDCPGTPNHATAEDVKNRKHHPRVSLGSAMNPASKEPQHAYKTRSEGTTVTWLSLDLKRPQPLVTK